MWQQIVQMLIDSVSAAFGWFSDILNSDRLIWSTVYFVIVAIFAARMILGPILGFAWVGRADQVIKSRSGKSGSSSKNSSKKS